MPLKRLKIVQVCYTTYSKEVEVDLPDKFLFDDGSLDHDAMMENEEELYKILSMDEVDQDDITEIEFVESNIYEMVPSPLGGFMVKLNINPTGEYNA